MRDVKLNGGWSKWVGKGVFLVIVMEARGSKPISEEVYLGGERSEVLLECFLVM